MRYLFIISLGIMMNIASCNNHRTSVIPNSRDQSVSIDLQPFHGVPAAMVEDIQRELLKSFSQVIINKETPLPPSAWYAPRNRYRADSIIGYLSKQTPVAHITIGLTDKDISTTKDSIADWGIMGLGFCPGNACIVSTFRLSKKDLSSQLYKLCLHEWGHTVGLPHCNNVTCLMRDAEGKNHFDEEKGFCDACKNKLALKNLHLKE